MRLYMFIAVNAVTEELTVCLVKDLSNSSLTQMKAEILDAGFHTVRVVEAGEVSFDAHRVFEV